MLDEIHKQFSEFCEAGRPNRFLPELEAVYRPGMSSFFCSESCPCKADRDSFPSTADYLGTQMNSSSGASTIRNCPPSAYTASSARDSVLALVGMMEEQFECSGICTRERWFYFSDVNRGPPKSRCAPKLLDYIDCMYDLTKRM